MYYTVYKITNRLNDKIYIGVHKTDDLNDSYMGSGTMLKRAIAKHGLENFKKEYLAVFDNADDMFKMESELVNEEFVKSADSYNIKEGGFGGWAHINRHSLNINEGQSSKGGLAFAKRMREDLQFKSIHSKRASATMKQTHAAGKFKYNTFSGRSHSDETKAKISDANSKLTGSRNSQFGSMWITDRVSNKKISKTDPIPQGWMKGRV